jgi:hypothetical protein
MDNVTLSTPNPAERVATLLPSQINKRFFGHALVNLQNVTSETTSLPPSTASTATTSGNLLLFSCVHTVKNR